MSRGNVGSAPAWVYQCGVAPFFPPEEESPRAIHLSHVNGNHYRALPLACASGSFCAVAAAIRETENRNVLDASAFRSAGSWIPLSSEHADTSPSSCLHCGLDHESGCCPNFTAEQRRSYNAVLGLPDDRGRLLDAQRQHTAAVPLIGWILVAVSSDMLRPYHSSTNRDAGVVVCALGTLWRLASGHAGLLMPL